jgi:hypothetical protein
MNNQSPIFSKEYANPTINDCTIANICNHPAFFRGHLRTTLGKLYKTGEFEKKSDIIMNTKLP